MAKRLPEKERIEGTRVSETDVGREVCRNCGGDVAVEAADRRSLELPHRRICRTCKAEYGTTAATLYPARKKYDLPAPGFKAEDEWL